MTPPPVMCAMARTSVKRAHLTDGVEVAAVGLEQQIDERPVGTGEHVAPLQLVIGDDVADQRVAVGVESAARHGQERVARPDLAPVDDLVRLDRAHDEAGDVVVTERVHPRHLGGLAADERAAGGAARLGDALDELGEVFGHELAGGVVVEEEERLGAAAENVVDAVIDQVDPDPAVAVGGDGDLDLGPHRVGAGGQHTPVR